MVEWWISGSEVSAVESTVEKRWKYRYGGNTVEINPRLRMSFRSYSVESGSTP